ncbi:hypothetical protein CLAFUW4_10406 [Fulvia fulva]|uniref:Uncharacterized protein n=1 Tax=Passalora fulva TaxID=5499 RepID=A0A9Q8LE55_PASFU|nr:uncharacterized protein CLAFUR5_05021 [Fulvia fulva]KAK4616050.1 hypothetical protein CLAFUR4_10410 [Fulvia fulva]KAK4617309.1 hypothetical protein CLAFUR0_10411 [Fulvia fulva]UJO15753.1 hypothetical protein CLAFUR5_05021 [Fulvia fulva]WPV18943.1 hypothetical protein CLAFUW4_10406 [Fulvia fulva]WPV34217.1 hypothetical protein CLAFUW7_10406 [Fulvia fulva]
MARYPTFDEYAKQGNYQDGIQRCDEVLNRMPKDVQLLITKTQLQAVAGQDIAPVLELLSTITPPLRQLEELIPIEAAVVDASKDVYPRPLTAGPVVAKLWDNAAKATTSASHKLDLLTVRFERAVLDDRLQDAQQSLIAMKAFQPKNRSIYMAHAAYTQLLSTSKDDLSSKLAMGLARKAVTEKFDDDKALDVRVAGQIFAIQGSEKDLEIIEDRPFRESKHVYEALKLSEPASVAAYGGVPSNKADPAKLSSRDWLDQEVTSLKDEFAKLAADSAASDVVNRFSANAIHLFHTAITSLDLGGRDRGAADACFLAVSGLINLYADLADTTYLLQAAYLADRLLKHNEHIYEARLILVYLYMQLGLGSSAMRFFDSLSVKEIQCDTVGHTLLTRLSITHPFRTLLANGDWFEPLERTYKALGIYPRHEDKLSETEASTLDHGQTGMIFDVHDLRNNLRLSYTRRLILLEHRRTSRLTGKAAVNKNLSDIGPRRVANWTNTLDNRDFNAAFDYGFNVESHLYGDGTIIVPGQKWLLHTLAADTAWALAKGTQSPLILDAENLASALAATRRDGTRDVEHLAGSLALQLIDVLLRIKADSSPSKDSIDAIITSVKSLPIEILVNASDPLAENLTDHYIYIDSLRTVLATCKNIKDTAEHIPVEVAELQSLARKLVGVLQNHVNEQIAGLKVNQVTLRLTEDEALREAMEMFGSESLSTFAESVVASAKEGWEGVGKITAL